MPHAAGARTDGPQRPTVFGAVSRKGASGTSRARRVARGGGASAVAGPRRRRTSPPPDPAAAPGRGRRSGGRDVCVGGKKARRFSGGNGAPKGPVPTRPETRPCTTPEGGLKVESSRGETAAQRLRASVPSAADRVQGPVRDPSDAEAIEPDRERLLDHIALPVGGSPSVEPVPDLGAESTRTMGDVRFLGPRILGGMAPKYTNTTYKPSLTVTTGTMARRPSRNRTALAGDGSGAEGAMRGPAVDPAPVRANVVSHGAIRTEMFGGRSAASAPPRPAAPRLAAPTAPAPHPGGPGSPPRRSPTAPENFCAAGAGEEREGRGRGREGGRGKGKGRGGGDGGRRMRALARAARRRPTPPDAARRWAPDAPGRPARPTGRPLRVRGRTRARGARERSGGMGHDRRPSVAGGGRGAWGYRGPPRAPGGDAREEGVGRRMGPRTEPSIGKAGADGPVPPAPACVYVLGAPPIWYIRPQVAENRGSRPLS